MTQQFFTVDKFGGTSLADEGCFRQVELILSDYAKDSYVVVVSAVAEVTNMLTSVVKNFDQPSCYETVLQEIYEKHLTLSRQLLSEDKSGLFIHGIKEDIAKIKAILTAMSLTKSLSPYSDYYILAYGELWSAQIMTMFLKESGKRAQFIDARDILVTDNSLTERIDWKGTRVHFENLRQKWEGCDHLIVTGFIARDALGRTATLGRNGSDVSAAIFANLFNARKLRIWTDVVGIMSADPCYVPESIVIDELSYEEANELAFFGAKVLHPSTIAPLSEKHIPLEIRSTFQPERPGSLVKSPSPSKTLIRTVKGVSLIEQVALVNVQGRALQNHNGFAEKIFHVLCQKNISIVLISQTSSEHSICFAVHTEDVYKVESSLRKLFMTELMTKEIISIDIDHACCIIAAIGDGMVSKKGISGRFFSALGMASVNVRAIAQGASERNISAAIRSEGAVRALRAVHSVFYLSQQTVGVGIIGPGLIGQTLLRQISDQLEVLEEQFHISLRVRGIINQKKMMLSDQPLQLIDWKKAESRGGLKKSDLAQFVRHMDSPYLPHSVIVDCSSSQEIAEHYPSWLARGINVVTPNKKANSGSLEFYQQLAPYRKQRRYPFYFYETTVGAGLPVISTLHDLERSGDEVLKIEAVLSGTLSYIFNNLKGNSTFSQIVQEAYDNGYMEPDPRDDLSGMDVARKVIILAREIGQTLSIEDLQVDNLVPQELRDLEDIQIFLTRLKEFDQNIQARVDRASDEGKVLRYIGIIEKSRPAQIGIRSYPLDHPFAGLMGSDNLILFTTRRYHQGQPLVIRGPGAGPEVTAGGVFADILRLASVIGRPL